MVHIAQSSVYITLALVLSNGLVELKHATAQFAQASVSSNDKTVQLTLLTQFTKKKKKKIFFISLKEYWISVLYLPHWLCDFGSCEHDIVRSRD